MPRGPRLPVRYPIVLGKTAIVVVDMQNVFVKEGAAIEAPAAREMVPRLNGLLDLCRETGIPVVYLKHILRGDGSDAGRLADFSPRIREGKALAAGSDEVEVYDDLLPKPGDIVVRKPRYSAFYGTDIESVLKTQGVDTLILAGTVTNICCESTARDAFSHDYKVIFLSDGNASFDFPDMGWGPVPAEEAQRVALTVMAYGFARVASIEEVKTELRGLQT